MHHSTKEAEKEKNLLDISDNILQINTTILVRGEINPMSWIEKNPNAEVREWAKGWSFLLSKGALWLGNTVRKTIFAGSQATALTFLEPDATKNLQRK